MPDVYQNEDGVIIITNPNMIKAFSLLEQNAIKGLIATGDIIIQEAGNE